MHMSIKKISGKCVKIISMMSLAIICVVLNAMLVYGAINEVSEYIGDNTSADEIMKVQEKWDSEFEIMKESIESNYSYIIK